MNSVSVPEVNALSLFRLTQVFYNNTVNSLTIVACRRLKRDEPFAFTRAKNLSAAPTFFHPASFHPVYNKSQDNVSIL